jgi:hypothetical protein
LFHNFNHLTRVWNFYKFLASRWRLNIWPIHHLLECFVENSEKRTNYWTIVLKCYTAIIPFWIQTHANAINK